MHSQVISLSVQKQTLCKGREIVAEDRDLPSLFEVLRVRVLGKRQDMAANTSVS